MEIIRTKLYQNKFFDLRSYEIERAKKLKEDITCIYEGKKMIIPLNEVDKRKLLLNKTPVKSKINIGQTYLMYSYLFVPMTEEDELRNLAKLKIFG